LGPYGCVVLDNEVENHVHGQRNAEQKCKSAEQPDGRMHFFADSFIARKRYFARPTRVYQSHDVSFPFTAVTIVGHRLVTKPSLKDLSLHRGIHSIVNGDFWGRLL
ncbi:hypothetical protein, partial [Brevundimonas sp.]|uniref:hypothetical protein n=1 Tax=Brevundimonas sp. TaxID=1871086 RepID=UPI002FC5A2F6